MNSVRQDVSWILTNRARALAALGVAVLAAAICWFFGADVWHALLFGFAVTIVYVVVQIGADTETYDSGWRGSQARAGGSRSDIVNLSGSLRGSWGRVGRVAEARLRLLARQRLAIYHLDLLSVDDRGAIERLIGPSAYRLLAGRRRGGMSLRSLLRCLDALDAIDAAHYPVPAPRRTLRIPFITTDRPRRARER